MLINKITDFLDIWRFECHNTDKILKNLTDDSLKIKFLPHGRTLGQLAWHIIETPKEMLLHTGLRIDWPEQWNTPPDTKQELVEIHRKIAESVEHQIKTHWNDESLHVVDSMYGEKWPRGKTLLALIFHLIHHRGQMTVLMRLAGLKVPGIYGPAQEEWAAMGMEPPSI